jgi:hypothetical protein
MTAQVEADAPMNILLIAIAVLLFLIADRIGVFSKNEWILPVAGFSHSAHSKTYGIVFCAPRVRPR